MCLRGILDDAQPIAAGDTEDGVHVARTVYHMHRDDGAAARCQPRFQIDKVDGQRLIDLDKHRNCTNEKDRSGRGHPSIGRNQNLVAQAYATGLQRTDQTRRSTADRGGLPSPCEAGQLRLKSAAHLQASLRPKQMTIGEHTADSEPLTKPKSDPSACFILKSARWSWLYIRITSSKLTGYDKIWGCQARVPALWSRCLVRRILS